MEKALNSDLLEYGVDEYAETPKPKADKSEDKKKKK